MNTKMWLFQRNPLLLVGATVLACVVVVGLAMVPGMGYAAQGEPDLAVTLHVGRTNIRVDEAVPVTMVVRHNGGAIAEGVTMTYTTPDMLSIASAQHSWGELRVAGQQLVVTMPRLFAGDVVTLTVVARGQVWAPGIRQGTVGAEVTSTSPERDLGNNRVAVPVRLMLERAAP